MQSAKFTQQNTWNNLVTVTSEKVIIAKFSAKTTNNWDYRIKAMLDF